MNNIEKLASTMREAWVFNLVNGKNIDFWINEGEKTDIKTKAGQLIPDLRLKELDRFIDDVNEGKGVIRDLKRYGASLRQVGRLLNPNGALSMLKYMKVAIEETIEDLGNPNCSEVNENYRSQVGGCYQTLERRKNLRNMLQAVEQKLNSVTR